MKVKDLLKVLVAEDLTVYLDDGQGNQIELENIDGYYYDNLANQQYFVDVDYKDIDKEDLSGCNLKADYIIDFDQFNECEVIKLNVESCWTELTIRL